MRKIIKSTIITLMPLMMCGQSVASDKEVLDYVGDSFIQNNKKSHFWLKQYNADAENEFDFMYKKGEGVPKNSEKATKEFDKKFRLDQNPTFLSKSINIESIKKIQEQEKSIIEWWLSVKDSFSQDNQIAITKTGAYKIIIYTSPDNSKRKSNQKVIKELEQALINVIPFSEQFDDLFEQRKHSTLKITSPLLVYLSFEADVKKARKLYFKE